MKERNDSKRRQFERLFASKHDFAQANFCARFLLKKGWHSKPWERRGTIYAQQSAFVTTLVVAYARPFTASKRWPAFPAKLSSFFDANQKEMHGRLLKLRHEIFAHSDSQHFSFRPFVSGDLRSTIEGVPFAVLSAGESEQVKTMTDDLIRITEQKLNELHYELAENLSDVSVS